VVPLKAPQGAPSPDGFRSPRRGTADLREAIVSWAPSRTDRIMVAAGRHDIEISNEALGFRTTAVDSGRARTGRAVRPDWPMGTIAINATPWANVTLDGKELGETPVGNTSVPIGTHEVIFRHPQLGEQRITATVTANTPARLSVDMRKK
jgi:hypothetical protein